MANVATAEILLKLNRSQYDAQLSTVRREFENFSRRDYGVSINNRDADLALQTTLGLARSLGSTLQGVGQQAVNEFRQFSGALQGAAAISGASSEEIAALKEEAIALGIATTKSPTQVAQAATAYTRLGFTASQATEDLGGLVQLSESTGSSLETSAQVTATATKIFGDSVSAIQAANVITASTTNTAVSSVDEFNQVLSKSAGIAKSNNVSFDELSATFGLLRTTGSSAEVAATAVKNSLINLTTPTKAGQEAIARLGLQVRDEQGNFVGLRNVIEDLRGSLDGLNPQERDQALKDIFGRFAGPAITSLLALDPNEFNRVFDAIAESSEGAGVAAEVADKRLQGLDRTLTLLEGTTQTTKAAVGEALAPAFNLAAKTVLELLNAFLGLPDPIQKTVVGLGAATAGVASLTIGLSTLRATQASDTFTKIGLSVGALKETLMATGSTVGNLAKQFSGAVGGAQISLPNLPAVGNGNALAKQRLAVIKEESAAQSLSVNERIAKEAEFFSFKKDLAAKEAALTSRRVAAEQGGNAIASQRAAAEAVKAKAIANSAKVDALAARAAATKSAADLKSAKSAQIAAAAEIKGSLSTKASTAATAINATATKAAAFAKDTLAVATGKATAASKSSAVATAASIVQFALFAAAALAVVEALKTFGLVANDSKKALNEFNDSLRESGVEIEESGEKQLGILDALRVGYAKLANVADFVLGVDLAANAEDVTTEAREQARAILAAEEANKSLFAVVDRGKATFDEYGISLADEATLTARSAEEKDKLTETFTEEIEERRKSIDAAKAAIAVDAKLAAQLNPTIALLEKQITQRENSIAVLNGETAAKQAEVEATEEQIASLKELQVAQSAANSQTNLNLSGAKADIFEGLAGGLIDEPDQQRLIAEAEKEAFQERLSANQAFIAELKALRTSDVSDEQSAELQEEITAAEQEQAKIRIDIARSEIAEQKRIAEERLQVLTDADDERIAAIESRATEIKKILFEEQLAGIANAEQTQERIGQAELQAIQVRLANRQKALSELQSAEGLDPQQLVKREGQAQKEILGLELELAQKQVQIREQAKARQLKAVQDAQSAVVKQFEQAQKRQELSLKQSLANQAISRDEFEQQSLSNQSRFTQQRIALLAQERMAVMQLAEDGILPQEEAQKRLGEIQAQVTSEQIKLVDQQIEAQEQLAQATQDRLDSELESKKLIAELTQQDLDFQKQAITNQSKLSEAQQGLTDAQTALSLQRLQFAKEDAASQREAFEIAQQIFQVEKSATLAQLDNEKRVLDIKVQQQQLDNQIATSQANIAILEAQAAIEAAKARDATSEELANLQKVLSLKQNILGQTEANAASQTDLFNIQRDTLAVNQEITREQLARDEQLLNRSGLGVETLSSEERRELDKDQRESNRIIDDLSDRSFSDSGSQASAIAEAVFSNRDNDVLFEDLDSIGGIAGEIGSLVEQLQGTEFTRREVREIERSFKDVESSDEVLSLLQQLIDVTESNGGGLTINASTANPVADSIDLLRETRR